MENKRQVRKPDLGNEFSRTGKLTF